MSNIVERILQFVNYKRISKRQFCLSIGTSTGFFNTPRENVSSSILEQIIKVYPEINPLWLITGQGEMIAPPEIAKKRIVSEQDLTKVMEWLIFSGELQRGAFETMSKEFIEVSNATNILQCNLENDSIEYCIKRLSRPQQSADIDFIKEYKQCYLEINKYLLEIQDALSRYSHLITGNDDPVIPGLSSK